jgi:NADH-quinone oxidoreductase subunit C
MSESPAEMLVRKVHERFPGALMEHTDFRGDLTILVDSPRLVEVARLLKDDPELGYTYLLYVTAVDWPARKPRFDVVWEVRCLARGTRVRLKARADMPDCRVPSLTGVWPAANWHERETYDLLGIRFDGHPDLRRILMPDTWEGHPLRKDYVSFGEPVIFSDEKLEGLEPDAIRG